MAIDLRTETPVPLADFGKLLQARPDYDTVRKWWKRGLRIDGSKKRVCLETIRLTRGRCTTMEAYYRFIETLNGSAP